jgi:hypothetical protein
MPMKSEVGSQTVVASKGERRNHFALSVWPALFQFKLSSGKPVIFSAVADGSDLQLSARDPTFSNGDQWHRYH